MRPPMPIWLPTYDSPSSRATAAHPVAPAPYWPKLLINPCSLSLVKLSARHGLNHLLWIPVPSLSVRSKLVRISPSRVNKCALSPELLRSLSRPSSPPLIHSFAGRPFSFATPSFAFSSAQLAAAFLLPNSPCLFAHNESFLTISVPPHSWTLRLPSLPCPREAKTKTGFAT